MFCFHLAALTNIPTVKYQGHGFSLQSSLQISERTNPFFFKRSIAIQQITFTFQHGAQMRCSSAAVTVLLQAPRCCIVTEPGLVSAGSPGASVGRLHDALFIVIYI